MTSNRRRLLLAIVISGVLMLGACIPEANRERGGDAGGDIGNWSEDMNLHGQEPGYERMYYETPLMGRGIERSGSAEGITPEP